MYTHLSDLIALIPLIAGLVSGSFLAVLGFNWTITTVLAFVMSLLAMTVIGVFLKRRHENQTVITVNRFTLK